MPVFLWRTSIFFFELLKEEAGVLIAHRHADAFRGEACGAEKLGSLGQALGLYQMFIGDPGMLLYICGEIIWVHIKKGRGGFQSAAGAVPLNIMQYGIDGAVMGIVRFQGVLEQVDQLADDQRHKAVQDRLRGDGGGVELTEELAGEAGKAALSFGGENEILIFLYPCVQSFDKKMCKIIILCKPLKESAVQILTCKHEINDNIVLGTLFDRVGCILADQDHLAGFEGLGAAVYGNGAGAGVNKGKL